MFKRSHLLPLRFFFLLLPIGYLAAVRAIFQPPLLITDLFLPFVCIALTLILTTCLKVEFVGNGYLRLNWAWVILPLLVFLSTGLSMILENNILAWTSLVAFLALTLMVQDGLGGEHYSWRWWLTIGLVGAITTLVLVLTNQVWTRYSEEEFFTAVQISLLFGFWVCLAIAFTVFPKSLFRLGGHWLPLIVKLRYLLIFVILLLFTGGVVAITSYQASFYASKASLYPGISQQSPFLCGSSSTPGSGIVNGADFFEDYIRRSKANQNQSAPEAGLLYLATDDPGFAGKFHDLLLEEANQNLFTAPANSVKFDQYLAAQRVYVYARVRERLPSLFSQDEQDLIAQWFHAINRRAMTVEWVDFLYGLAFSVWPEGPYENQENGAGLLAMLEAEHLGDPSLKQNNIDYLERHRRGWETRFNNSDDSLIYQAEWITNAHFQKLYTGFSKAENIHNSFEWILLQMLPDGRAPQYNTPGGYELTSTLYLGARMLRDGRFLWLADRSLNSPGNAQFRLHPGIGTEGPLELTGTAPVQGSCLLYSNSGLPTQVGPLAPDKVVFRQGWSPQNLYLLLNLRFEGWHRYKGSNTITLIDKAEPLVFEQINGKALAWLPKGRSLFRDKRIPRENLNGFQIPRRGLDAVLVQLLGYGSYWAQDPPFLAQVDEFATGEKMDVSQTSLVDWHGWTQTRKIIFLHDGVVIVLDDAQGPADQLGAVTWHLVDGQRIEATRFKMGSLNGGTEMLVLDQDGGQIETDTALESGDSSTRVLYRAPTGGRLRLVTVFLTDKWVGAEVNLLGSSANQTLVIKQTGSSVQLEVDLRLSYLSR